MLSVTTANRRPIRRACDPPRRGMLRSLMSKRHRRSAGMAMGLFVAIGACRAQTAPRLALSPCHVERLGPDARCGQLEVFENRAAPPGRKIALRNVALPSFMHPPPADPVLLPARA